MWIMWIETDKCIVMNEFHCQQCNGKWKHDVRRVRDWLAPVDWKCDADDDDEDDDNHDAMLAIPGTMDFNPMLPTTWWYQCNSDVNYQWIDVRQICMTVHSAQFSSWGNHAFRCHTNRTLSILTAIFQVNLG